MADTLTPLPVKTKTNGDIVAKIVDSGGTNVAAVDATGHVKVVADTTTIAGAAVKTSDYDTGGGVDTVPMMGIALPASGGAVQGGTTANPIVDTLVDAPGGTSVMDTSLHAVKVSVVSGGTGSPTTPEVTVVTTVDVPTAGSKIAKSWVASATGDTATAVNNQEIPNGQIGYLQQVIMTSSVPMKWEIATSTGVGPTVTDKAFFFTTAANLTVTWTPPDKTYVQAVGTASSNDGFQVTCFNQDPSNAAPAYVTFVYDMH